MSEQIIVKHCSPTLAGLKTASLFSCEYTNIDELKRNIYRLNSILNQKGVYFLLLKAEKKRSLIYVYRPAKLAKDLEDGKMKSFLKKVGYKKNDIDYCLNHLKKRLVTLKSFPHEIGVFLGYPLTDVCGFIENRGENFKACGYWKVYDDMNFAEKMFQKYRKCTQVYCRKIEEGSNLLRLTVA